MPESHSVSHYMFINNVIGTMIQGYGKFFKAELFDRSTEIVIATYEKAVQHYKDKISKTGDNHHPGYPFLTLDPSLDFEPDDRAGRFLYQYPSFDRAFAKQVFEPKLYEDDNVTISPVLNRYKGRLELIIWCGSVYESIDNRVLAYQFFGGLNRPIYPASILGYFILPDEYVYYTYDNPYTSENYQLDWPAQSIQQMLIKNINKEKWVYPFYIRPYIKLTGVSDATEKYGGDSLAEWKISLDMEWECDIPTHLIFHVKKYPKIRHSIFDIGVGFHYLPGSSESAPDQIIKTVTDPDTGEITSYDLELKQVFMYEITEEDKQLIDSDQDFTITLSEDVASENHLYVYSKYGQLRNRYHWILSDPTTVTLLGFNLKTLEAEDNITLVKYIDS